MVELSPFPIGGPLRPDEVTGREELVRDLSERLLARRVTALLGPRRYGKTSVLRKVAADLAGVGPETVWIDLYGLSSMADLAGRLDEGLAQTRGNLRRAIATMAESMSLKLGAVTVEFTRNRLSRPDAILVARPLLQLLVKAAERHDLLLVLDEFSGVARVDGAAALLRTGLQHHYRDLSIVFAGSEPSMMRALFTDRAEPFFGQAELLEIGPMADSAVAGIVVDGFDRTGRDVGEIDQRIVAMAQGHPYRAMELADALWRCTEPGATADDAGWDLALQSVRAGVAVGSEALFQALPLGSQRVLRAIATDGKAYGATAEVLGLAAGTARTAIQALVGEGHLDRRDGKLVLTDPMFADWIRQRFPGPA